MAAPIMTQNNKGQESFLEGPAWPSAPRTLKDIRGHKECVPSVCAVSAGPVGEAYNDVITAIYLSIHVAAARPSTCAEWIHHN